MRAATNRQLISLYQDSSKGGDNKANSHYRKHRAHRPLFRAMLGSNVPPTPDIVAYCPVETINPRKELTKGLIKTLTMIDHVFLDLSVREQISRQEISAADAKAKVDGISTLPSFHIERHMLTFSAKSKGGSS